MLFVGGRIIQEFILHKKMIENVTMLCRCLINCVRCLFKVLRLRGISKLEFFITFKNVLRQRYN